MMNNSDSAELRKALVQQIIEKTGVSSLPIIHAFTQIPREAFVRSFLEEQEQSNTWVTVSSETIGSDRYLQKIYTDDSLVVQVNHQGWPCSSSSTPSIMAVMLEALDVRREQNILEIGTATGYNAAILAYLTRNAARVTTIDHDNARALSETATQALHEIVGPVHTIIGDGFQGVLTNAPYDRIIATASAPTIPTPWVEQLVPDGILVMDLHGSLESGFFVFKKDSDGHGGHGHFLEKPLHFMPLISEHVPSIFVAQKFLHLLREPHQQRIDQVDDQMVSMLLHDQAFRWFLQWYIPSCNIVELMNETTDVFLVDSHQQSIVQLHKTADGWIADVFGTSDDLWDIVQEALHLFTTSGNPSQAAYALDIHADGTKTMSTRSFYFQMK